MTWKNAISWILYGAVIVAVLVVFGVFIFQLSRGPQAPFTYTQDTYTAEHAVYAPKQTLVYTASLTIERYGAVTGVRGFRTRPNEAWPRLCDGTLAPVIPVVPPPFSPGAVGREVEGRITVDIPALPPGDYWLISSITKQDGGEAVTRVGFRVETPCNRG